MTNVSKQENNPLENLISFFRKIHDLESQIISLETLIESKQKETIAAQEAIGDVRHLVREREDILAAISLGEKPIEALTEFDEKTANAFQEHADKKTLSINLKEDNEQAVKGITRKLIEAKNALNVLNDDKKNVTGDYIKSRAEQLGAEYVKAATQTKDLYVELQVLNMLDDQWEIRKANIRAEYRQLLIPKFSLSACLNISHHYYPGILYGELIPSEMGGLDLYSEFQKKVAELNELGITR